MFTLKNIADKLELSFYIGDNEYLKNLMFINEEEIYGFRGCRKSIPQFLKRVKDLYPEVNDEKLSEDYLINIRLIRSNYNIVRDYHKASHLYPNLEFRYEESNELKMKEYSRKFRLLEGLVLPINDLFWNTYLPPNHFEDNCTIYLTDKEITSIPNNLPYVDHRFTADRHNLFFNKQPFCVKVDAMKSCECDSLKVMGININKLQQEVINDVYGKK